MEGETSEVERGMKVVMTPQPRKGDISVEGTAETGDTTPDAARYKALKKNAPQPIRTTIVSLGLTPRDPREDADDAACSAKEWGSISQRKDANVHPGFTTSEMVADLLAAAFVGLLKSDCCCGAVDARRSGEIALAPTPLVTFADAPPMMVGG